jgi:hypothetical protein
MDIERTIEIVASAEGVWDVMTEAESLERRCEARR